MDKALFYKNLKANGLFKKITPIQDVCMDAILAQCKLQGVTDPEAIAYVLGTIYHETMRTMEPIEEKNKGHNRTYGYKVWYNGKEYRDVPFIYYGRGFTQNTWRDVYKALTAAAKRAGHGWDFENVPSLLLQVEPSAWASIYAMRTGLYTGKRLSNYFTEEDADYINARRIITGKRPGQDLPESAELVAGYAKKFFKSIP